MPVAFGSASPAATGEEVDNITSASWTIDAGSNIAVFGGAIGAGFGGHSPAAIMRLGGSGGSDLTKIGSDMTFPSLVDGNAWRRLGVSAGSTSAYANWAAAPQFSIAQMLAYTGVHQTTPTGTPATGTLSIDATGSGTVTTDVTGTVSGDVVLGFVAVEKGDLGTVTYTPGTGCTIRAQAADGANVAAGIWIERTASGSTTTMALGASGTNGTGSGTLEIIAFVVNAEGGAAVIPGAGAVTVSGLAPTVAVSTNTFAFPSVGSAAIAGLQPSTYQFGAQVARPASDIATGGWTPSTGSSLYDTINESLPDDADYDQTVLANEQTFTVALNSVTDPNTASGHTVRYRLRGSGSSVVVTLLQGTTTIASWTHTPPPADLTTYTQTLSSGEANAISDYTALRLSFKATP